MEENGKTWKDFPDIKTNQDNANAANWKNHKSIVAGIRGKVWKTLLILSSLLVFGCNLPTKAKGLPWKVLHCYSVDVCGYFALLSEWLWASLSFNWFPGVKHQKRRKTRLCCRSEGSGLWMWLDAMWSATCRLVFFNFPVASHVCHWICCLHVINMKSEWCFSTAS